MKVARTIAAVREAVSTARRGGATIGLVPTMGALHEGHYSLIEAAADACGLAVVSIFVNPTQFGPGEDYGRYPRTPEADLAGCEARGVGAVFMPPVEEMYRREPVTTVHVAGLTERLCGRSRPGHFDGVCTVVAKLLAIVGPDAAYFGAKDYQQASAVRRMVADLSLPVRIEVLPTVRAADGLALSSRNELLSDDERAQAPAIYAALCEGRRRVAAGCRRAGQVAQAVRDRLRSDAPDGRIDYVEIVDPDDLQDVEEIAGPVVIAAAVRFPSARLIDNIRVDGPADGPVE